MILSIYQLCSKEKNADRETYLFMRRILDRRHGLDVVTSLFSKAIHTAKRYLQRSPAHNEEPLQKKAKESKRQV